MNNGLVSLTSQKTRYYYPAATGSNLRDARCRPGCPSRLLTPSSSSPTIGPLPAPKTSSETAPNSKTSHKGDMGEIRSRTGFGVHCSAWRRVHFTSRPSSLLPVSHPHEHSLFSQTSPSKPSPPPSTTNLAERYKGLPAAGDLLSTSPLPLPTRPPSPPHSPIGGTLMLTAVSTFSRRRRALSASLSVCRAWFASALLLAFHVISHPRALLN